MSVICTEGAKDFLDIIAQHQALSRNQYANEVAINTGKICTSIRDELKNLRDEFEMAKEERKI